MEQQTTQPKKLLVSILVSSLVTNVILLSITGASLAMIFNLNKEVQQIKERVDGVRQVVDALKAVRDTVKTKLRDRRQGDASAPEQTDNEAKPKEETAPPPRRPLRRLRGK